MMIFAYIISNNNEIRRHNYNLANNDVDKAVCLFAVVAVNYFIFFPLWTTWLWIEFKESFNWFFTEVIN